MSDREPVERPKTGATVVPHGGPDSAVVGAAPPFPAGAPALGLIPTHRPGWHRLRTAIGSPSSRSRPEPDYR